MFAIDSKNTEIIRNFLCSWWNWYDNKPQFDMHNFEKDLHFQNCDYRPFILHKQISTAEYILCGNIIKAKVAKNLNLKMKYRV
jgi:hypothetical protein